MAHSKKIRPLWTEFTYFPHQLEGINWMLEKELVGIVVPGRNNTAGPRIYGGFQCDDMGLGKTIQVASVIVNNPCRRTLLLAPLAMIETWSGVLMRAGCIVYEVCGGEWHFMNSLDTPIPRHFMKCRPSVYITNYEKVYHNWSLFSREWDRVVLDEAHKIRNGDGDVARYCRRIVAPIRWAVTGTPLVNSLSNIVSLLAFLGVPHSTLWRWEARYLQILPEILIHRSLDSLRGAISDAPPAPEIINLVLPFTTRAEEEFYYGVQGATEAMVKKYSGELLSSSQAFLLLLRLRQISVHPQVYINAKRRESDGKYSRDDWVAPSTKLEKIGEILRGEIGSSVVVHKYIIFCQFNDEIDIIHEYLLGEGLVAAENILHYNGSMNQAERSVVLAKSKETTDTTVLLLQLQAGGVGLNLQEYDRIIFVSPWWTSALMDQAIARAVRMGQREVVKVYHLQLAAETGSSDDKGHSIINIDSMIQAKAEEKRKLLEKLFALCTDDKCADNTETNAVN